MSGKFVSRHLRFAVDLLDMHGRQALSVCLTVTVLLSVIGGGVVLVSQPAAAANQCAVSDGTRHIVYDDGGSTDNDADDINAVIANASDGDVVVLDSNTAVWDIDEDPDNVRLDKNITLDLNGTTVREGETNSGKPIAVLADHVTIANGTIDSADGWSPLSLGGNRSQLNLIGITFPAGSDSGRDAELYGSDPFTYYAENGMDVQVHHGASVTEEDAAIEFFSCNDQPPTADFSFSPETPGPGDTVSFDGSNSTDPDGSIASYEWNYDDGSANDSGVSPSHIFSSSGTYNVTLTVTDDGGNTNSTTKTVEVNDGPTADIDYDPSDPEINEQVEFDGSGSTEGLDQIVSYDWYIDSAYYASGTTINPSFGSKGVYNVTLIVTDDGGLSDQESVDVTVTDDPAPSFTASSTTINAGDSVSFDASNSFDPDGVINSYDWDFGDGNSDTGVTTTHTFTTPATETVELEVTDDSGRSATTDTTITVNPNAPELSNPSPANNEIVNKSSLSFSVDVADEDFDLAGDTVTIELYHKGNKLQEKTANSNGTVSFSATPSNITTGANEWSVIATDSYGASTTEQWEYLVPGDLTIREETTFQPINVSNSSLEIKFYGEKGVHVLEPDSATVDLLGVPADDTYVVVVRADDYYTRQVIVPSIFEQRDILVLNKSVPAVETEFELDDFSGNFPPEESKIYVERAVTVNNSTTYMRVAGDDLGAAARFPIYLEKDTRYKLYAENDQGDQRYLGHHTASRAGTFELGIRKVDFGEPAENQWQAWLDTEDLDANTTRVSFQFSDDAIATTDFSIRVYEAGNKSNEVFSDSWSGPRGDYTTQVDLDRDTRWIVNWTATRNNSTIGQEVPVGSQKSVDLPLDSSYLGALVVIVLTFIASLGTERYASYIAVSLVTFAAIIMALQWMYIPPSAWWAAVVIAVGGHIARESGIR